MRVIAIRNGPNNITVGQSYKLINSRRFPGNYKIGNTGLTVKTERISYWFKLCDFKYGK